MPTGYTHKVQTGEITTLRDFAMTCARAFGFTITMRDEPSDAPIPDEFTPSQYHAEQLAKYQEQRHEIVALTEEQIAARIADVTRKTLKENVERIDKHFAAKANYDAMLAQVLKWKPPVELADMREFMIKQLQESIRFDCRHDPYQERLPVSDPKEYRESLLRELDDSIAYHKKEYAQEVARTNDRNRYLRMLRESLAALEEGK